MTCAIGDRTNLIVVAQSLGAFTAPLVCDRVAVELLVLVAHMIPAPGEAPDSYRTHTRYNEEVQDRYDDAIALFYQDVPPELAAQALNRARIQSEARMGEPSPLRAWPDTPTRVLICRDDRLFPLHFLRCVARERLGITPDEIDGGHTPALSRPHELADRLEVYAAEQGLPGRPLAGIAAYLPKRAQESCRSPLSQPGPRTPSGGVPSMMSTGYQRRPGGPDRREGTAVRHAESEHTPGPSGYDAELRRHNEVLRRAVGVQLHDHTLDIGCGTGQTTRQAARTAQAGSALGVDVSAPAIERARELAQAEGLRNVTFEHANAQAHRFPPERFDLAISRFGTMFFDDPVAAFANIRRALRPAGRLVMMVWQAHERNEWDIAIHQSLGAAEGPVSGASELPDPFSLADPPTVKEILQAAGFADVDFTDVHEPVYYGPDVAAALDWTRGFTCIHEVLKRLDPAAATHAVQRLREALAAHMSDDGVWFNSRAWIVTARRH